jgi:hypothetical protein
MAPRDLLRQVVPSPLRRSAWKAAVALERGQQARNRHRFKLVRDGEIMRASRP